MGKQAKPIAKFASLSLFLVGGKARAKNIEQLQIKLLPL
jgi:hypothetical protein